MTTEKAWRDAMKTYGVDIDAMMATLDRACAQPGIPTDDEIALAEVALQHSADMFTAGKLSQAIQYGREARALIASLGKELSLIPEVIRNRARDAGTRKPRNAPLQEAVNRLVERHPALTAKELWREASSVITDQIEFERFRKRVTEARQMGRK